MIRIKEIRSYLHIPLSGFDKDDQDVDEEVEKWSYEMDDRSDKMMSLPEFRAELIGINEKLKVKEIDEDTARRLSKKVHFKIPINYLTRSCENLIQEFNLPANYADEIRRHIIFAETYGPAKPFIEIREVIEDKPRDNVTLKIFTKLTTKDAMDIKRYVNRVAGRYLPDFGPLKDIDKKLATEEYYRNRFVFDEDSQKDRRINAKEIAENIKADTGKKIKPDDVYEIIRELEDLRQKRFKKSGKK